MLTPADLPPTVPDASADRDTPAGAPRVLRGLPALLPMLREAKSGLLVLALVVGSGAGLGAIAFRWLIKTFTRVLSGHADYSAAGHAANAHVPWLGHWFVLLAPVAGRAGSTARWCSASPGRRAATGCPR